MRAKDLPASLTSYDLLKAFAIVLTVLDHVGYYFYPDQLWLRAAGRLCVPVWFFLIGYAHSRDLGPRIWIASLVLMLAGAVAGMSLMPFYILVTFIVIRLVIDHIAQKMASSPAAFWSWAVILSLLALPTCFLSEYGTAGFLFALAGWMMRHKDEVPQGAGKSLMTLAAVVYITLQQAIFIFTDAQFMAMTAGLIVIIGVLCFFKPAEYPGLTARLPRPAVGLVHILGRRTLEIYVLHLILFKALGVMFQPERFVLFDWKIFSLTGI